MRYETMLRSAIALSVLAVSPVSAAHAQLRDRSYATRGNSLEVDGKTVGTVQSVDGGYAKADVATMSIGPDDYPMKHVAGVRFEPITIHGDVGTLADLAKRALDKPTPVSGRVTTMSVTGKGIASLEFFDAIPTRVVISDLDASSKDACYIEITLTPERTRRVDGGAAGAQMMSKQEKCVRSNFTVKIPGLVTTGVTKVENLALTREVAPDNVGGQQRIETKHPTKPSIPNIVLTVSDATAKDFWTWYDSFLLKGDNGQDKEKTIDVQLTSPDLKSVALTLQGTGVGMVAIRPLTGTGDSIARVEVELYVTRWAIAGVAAP